jgi:hypothetical protein
MGPESSSAPITVRGRWSAAKQLVLASTSRSWLVAAAAILLAPLIVATSLTVFGSGPADPLQARLVSPQTMQDGYGIKLDMVAVTAAGGLVDMRFTVTDGSKASQLFHDPSTAPALLVDGTDAVLHMRRGMNHHLALLTGSRYFVLFPNAGGVIQRGTPVSVVIDDIRLEPIPAQS